MRRLRPADWLVLLSVLAVPVTLVLNWFSAPRDVVPLAGAVGYAPLEAQRSGWDALGWATLLLILVTVALALVLVALIASGTHDAVNLPPGVFLAALSPLTLLVTLVATLLKPGGATGIEVGAWAGLAALAAMTAGAWLSLHDQRVDQPSRKVEPPPARPAPPAA